MFVSCLLQHWRNFFPGITTSCCNRHQRCCWVQYSQESNEGINAGPTPAGGGDAISLPPDLVANTALSSLNIHSGIMLLEDSIMRTGLGRAVAAAAAATTTGGAATSSGGKRRRRGSGGGRGAQQDSPDAVLVVDLEQGQQESWLQLSKLYAALGERDALVGVAARASKLDGTR